MSRSYKHYPHIGFADSEKYTKKCVNKRFRRIAKLILANSSEPEHLGTSSFPSIDEIKDPYYFPKDGGVDIDPKDEFWRECHHFIGNKLRK